MRATRMITRKRCTMRVYSTFSLETIAELPGLSRSYTQLQRGPASGSRITIAWSWLERLGGPHEWL